MSENMYDLKLNEINISENGDLNVITQLKDEHKPILIYGCANHAELVYQYLCEHGLSVESFIVDQQYWVDDSYIKGLKINTLEDYINCINDYSVVIGFCNVQKTQFLLNNSLWIKCKLYLLWEPLVVYEWSKAYIKDNWNELYNIYSELGDSTSKKIMSLLIDAKLNRNGRKLLNYADDKQYFNELTCCIDSQNEIYVDCGAFNGDTILKYIDFTDGKYNKIYAFEPNPKNVSMLEQNISDFNNIEIVKKGTWNINTTLEFEENGSASQIVEAGGGLTSVEVITIDEIVGEDKVTFIKMDVEGSELESLQGAAKTIRRNKPKLAICCYHKQNDIINLYNFINAFSDEEYKYRFYLRHHSNSAYETVLYAIPVHV